MNTKILALMIGFLLVGANLYAAGDLVVNGQLRLGTIAYNPPKLYLNADTKSVGIYVDVPNAGYGSRYNVTVGGSSGTVSGYGVDMNANLSTTGASVSLITGANYEIRLAASSPTTIEYLFANRVRFARLGNNAANHTATNVAGISYDIVSAGGTGMVTTPSYKGMYLSDNSALFNGTTHSQIWLDKITGGTTNYGIVLNGDGAGADIVFGPGQNVKLYTKTISGNTDLWVKDSQNNETPLGPHDPATGEWIFYSKNIKTGRTVRVEMEKLVKAVEKLTGEKFMVESLTEEK